MRPVITLKAAISIDGYLDDSSSKRRIFSSIEDSRAVDELRARCDAILLGAETLRRDDPSLLIRDSSLIKYREDLGKSSHPLAIVLSSSGRFDTNYKVFNRRPLLCLPESLSAQVTQEVLEGSEQYFFKGPSADLKKLLQVLKTMGIDNLLVEGGAKVLAQFYQLGLYDEIRLSVAPVVLGKNGASPINLPVSEEVLKLKSVQKLASSAVHFFN